MDLAVAAALCQLNTRFYEQNASSFSVTRQSKWPGWERVAEAAGLNEAAAAVAATAVEGSAIATVATAAEGSAVAAAVNVAATNNATPAAPAAAEPFRVLDLACGNLRFEQFLEGAYSQVPFEFTAVDNCDDLMTAASASLQRSVAYQHVDLTEVLVAASSASGTSSDEEVRECTAALSGAIAIKPANLAVAFGFLHHLPLFAWRVATLRALIASVKPGGLVAVSLWEFMNSPQLAEKAVATHAEALDSFAIDFSAITPDAFEPGDYLLGWNNQPGQYRYCHSFTRAEVDELVAAVSDIVQPEARFHADGRTNDLNEYVVLRVL